MSQAELLAVYGADPGAPDTSGKTPVDYAKSVCHPSPTEGQIILHLPILTSCKHGLMGGSVLSRRQAGHQDLAERLVEIQYELTDRLAFYLCGRKPGEREKSTSHI